MTAELYQRWHIRDCARCGRRAAKAANWPDRPICRTCFAKATEVRGRCPACSTDRLLPGRRPDGTAVCRDCAGITRNFFCDRCSSEGYLLGGRLCRRCTLSDQLQRILDDGSGQVHPPLLALVQALVSMPHPKTALAWLASAQVRALLADLATGAYSSDYGHLFRLKADAVPAESGLADGAARPHPRGTSRTTELAHRRLPA